MRGNSHARCGVGENSEITSKNYLSLYILPPDLVTYSNDAKTLLEDLQSRNERMFLLTFLVVNMAPTRRELDNDLFTVSGIVQKYNCTLKRLDFQQEDGFLSSLPLSQSQSPPNRWRKYRNPSRRKRTAPFSLCS